MSTEAFGEGGLSARRKVPQKSILKTARRIIDPDRIGKRRPHMEDPDTGEICGVHWP